MKWSLHMLIHSELQRIDRISTLFSLPVAGLITPELRRNEGFSLVADRSSQISLLIRTKLTAITVDLLTQD